MNVDFKKWPSCCPSTSQHYRSALPLLGKGRTPRDCGRHSGCVVPSSVSFPWPWHLYFWTLSTEGNSLICLSFSPSPLPYHTVSLERLSSVSFSLGKNVGLFEQRNLSHRTNASRLLHQGIVKLQQGFWQHEAMSAGWPLRCQLEKAQWCQDLKPSLWMWSPGRMGPLSQVSVGSRSPAFSLTSWPTPAHVTVLVSTAELGWVYWSSGIILTHLLRPFVFPEYPCLYLEPFSDRCCWDLGWTTPKYITMEHCLFWIKVS